MKKRIQKLVLIALASFSYVYSVPIRVILNNNTNADLSITARCESTGSRPLVFLIIPATQKDMVQFDSLGQCSIEAIYRVNRYDLPKLQGVLGLNIEKETAMYGDYNIIWTRGGVRPPGTIADQTQWEIDYTINQKQQ